MPPKQDLRGGQASADSFAISTSVFVASMNRCFFAAKSCKAANEIIPWSRTRIWRELCIIGVEGSFS